MNALTFGLVITIIEAFTHDVHISLIIAAIVIVLFCGYFYVRREERQAYPLLPIDLLRIPLFTLSIITSVFSFIAQMLAMVSFPFFLQRVLGRDEVATGLLLTPCFGDNGMAPFGRDLVGENECRGLEWYRVDYLLGRVVLVGGITGASF